MLRNVLVFCAMTVVFGLAAQNVSAQPASGGISGIVRDSSGEAVRGVQLTIKNLADDRTQTTTSDATGTYNLQNLMAGFYEITASKYGFGDTLARVAMEAGQS